MLQKYKCRAKLHNKEVVALGRVKNLRWKLPLFALYGAVLVLWHALKLPCVWQALFGIICPGCGMSRAWLAALRLDFAKAFSLHPMFWSVPFLALYILFDGQLFKNKWVNYGALGLILGGFVICYMIRLSGWNWTI